MILYGRHIRPLPRKSKTSTKWTETFRDCKVSHDFSLHLDSEKREGYILSEESVPKFHNQNSNTMHVKNKWLWQCILSCFNIDPYAAWYFTSLGKISRIFYACKSEKAKSWKFWKYDNVCKLANCWISLSTEWPLGRSGIFMRRKSLHLAIETIANCWK